LPRKVVAITLVARSVEMLSAAAAKLQQDTRAAVETVTADIAMEGGRERALRLELKHAQR
jgi:short-subunit dehydrogenase